MCFSLDVPNIHLCLVSACLVAVVVIIVVVVVVFALRFICISFTEYFLLSLRCVRMAGTNHEHTDHYVWQLHCVTMGNTVCEVL